MHISRFTRPFLALNALWMHEVPTFVLEDGDAKLVLKDGHGDEVPKFGNIA